MRHCLLAILLLTGLVGCATSSDKPERVIYDDGVSADASNGEGPTLPLTRHTVESRAHDTHPYIHTHNNVQWLYFASDRDGDGFNLYRKRLNTHAVERLTHLEGDEFWPKVSPDGNWLAFGSNTLDNWDIWLLDLRAPGKPQLLTQASPQDDIQPAWSPDGGRLVFSSYSSTMDEWLIRGLTFGEPVDWQPSAPGLAREETMGTAENAKDAEGVDGPILRKVTSHWSLFTAGSTPLIGMHPVFRPGVNASEDMLAFQDHRRDDAGWFTVRLYSFATGLTTTLTPPRGYGAVQPSFSPDGKRVVYLTVGKGTDRDRGGDGVAISDLSGQVVADLRNPAGKGEITDPHWTTEGGEAKLFFGLVGDEGEAIYSVSLASRVGPDS